MGVLEAAGWITLFILIKFTMLFATPYFVFWRWFDVKLKHLKIQNPERQKPQPKLELAFSAATMIVQILLMTFIFWGVQKSYFKIYSGFGSQGYTKEILAFIAYIFFYDAYFYWSHRLLHVPWLYRSVHHVHHRSLNPTPFASFSFHPVESVINVLYFLPFVFTFSMSLQLFIFLLILTDFSNLMGHLGYDLIPRRLMKSRWGNWLTTPTHHNLHHQYSRSNYALYFKWWDTKFKTLHPRTADEFFRVKDQS